MLLLGAAGRNAGKTLFACRLIEQLRKKSRVVALKVSTIRGEGGECVRGRTDCGVCSSLKLPYELIEERDPDGKKDTSRMAGAGAETAYWLKARPWALDDGIKDFLGRLDPGVLVVCESNSLREVVVPDLFLMFRGGGTTKKSARGVLKYVDREVRFENGTFDLNPSDLFFVDGQFTLPRPGSAVLLAGGKSSRMGEDKRYLSHHGSSLMEHAFRELSKLFTQVIVSANDEPVGIPIGNVVADASPGNGPIGGIESGIDAAKSDPVFVSACDIPRFDLGILSSLFREIEGNDIAVPRNNRGRYESLFALYTHSTLPVVRSLMESGELRIRKLFDLVPTAGVAIPTGSLLYNVNTRAEYEALTRSMD